MVQRAGRGAGRPWLPACLLADFSTGDETGELTAVEVRVSDGADDDGSVEAMRFLAAARLAAPDRPTLNTDAGGTTWWPGRKAKGMFRCDQQAIAFLRGNHPA